MGKDRKRNEATKQRRTAQKRKKVIGKGEASVAKRVKESYL